MLRTRNAFVLKARGDAKQHALSVQINIRPHEVEYFNSNIKVQYPQVRALVFVESLELEKRPQQDHCYACSMCGRCWMQTLTSRRSCCHWRKTRKWTRC